MSVRPDTRVATSRRGLIVAAALAACGRARATVAPPALRIGVERGAQAKLLQHAQALSATQGLAMQVVVRDDTHRFAGDVADGLLDAAAWNDGVRFADDPRRARGELAVATALFTLPTALYARRLTSPHQLDDGAMLAIPADAVERARALVLLQNLGLLVLRDDAGLHATLHDIVANPRRLRLVTLPAPRLFDALSRLPAAVLDYDTANRAGLQPARDAIAIEDARTPFGGVLAVRRDRLAQPWLAPLVATLHGVPLRRFALERFQDSVRRPW